MKRTSLTAGQAAMLADIRDHGEPIGGSAGVLASLERLDLIEQAPPEEEEPDAPPEEIEGPPEPPPMRWVLTVAGEQALR